MRVLEVNSCGVTLELGDKTPYFSHKSFDILVNGIKIRSENRNVFSLFGLPRGQKLKIEAGEECAEIIIPEPAFEACVKDFGAAGDGVRDDTAAFTAAINCLPENSVIRVPEGDYLIKPVFLKSGITLYLEKGARLSGDTVRGNYPVLPAVINGNGGDINLGTWQGEEAPCFASLITAVGQQNIKVAGEGTIDCRAQAADWYQNHRVMRGAWRPRGIFLNSCQNVILQGITVKNTPSWNIHPYFCKNVKIYDVNLINPEDMPTTDGIDPDCSDGVEIIGAHISVGDDCIAIKSGTLELAKKYRTPCKNIKIRNCLMEKGHGGVVLGSELSGGIQDISVSRSIFEGTDRGLRIKTRRGRGRVGSCGGITFSDIVMNGVKVPFVINMYYNMGDESGHFEYVWTAEKLPVDERTPALGSFTFKNISCTGVEYCAGAFYGLPEAPVGEVVFDSVTFDYNTECQAGYPDMREKNRKVKCGGLYFEFVEKVVLKSVKINGQSGEKIIKKGVTELTEI